MRSPHEDPGLVLHIHPWGHLNDLVVPAGVLACLNAIPGPKLGRYAFEVADDEIARACVVTIDVHWALALTGFEHLVAHVRAVAPRVPIVVGGITAALLADELLASYPVDFVFRGDAETSFTALIAALRAGQQPGPLPNVHQRGAPTPPPRRMSSEDFDASDSVRLDWFPTLAKVTDLDAVAFPTGRTIIGARGCPLRCPTCYGSHASTYGGGYLWRSPERTAELLRDAERAGGRNVRLILSKPTPRQLSGLIAALGATGPYRFGSAVGLFLCRAPSDDELAALDRAFESPVTISVVPPDEHVPPLSPERLATERAEWRRVSRWVAASKNLRLDVWSTVGRDTRALRAELGDHDRVSVNSGAVWSMTRPADGASLPPAREAVRDLWTFYAARLLSPSLAALLTPFRFLDEVDDEVEALPPPEEPALRPYHAAIVSSWRAHRLPMIRGLAFELVPVDGVVARREAAGTSFSGALAIGQITRSRGGALPLEARFDHRGVSLHAEVPARAAAGSLAILPRGLPLDDAARRGVVVLRGEHAADARVRIDLRVQDARVFLLGAGDELLQRGVAGLGYFRKGATEASP